MSIPKGAKKVALLYERQNGLCHLCGGKMWLIWGRGCRIGGPAGLHATIDHDVPTALGGTNEMENLRAAHYDCNHVKGMASIKPVPLPCYESQITWADHA